MTSIPFISLDDTSTAPIYRQIYDEIRRSILSGGFASGLRLPASRLLAEQLGVSRMTVVVDSDEVSVDRVTAYLYKLVNVLQVEDLRDVPAVARDLALVKVAVAGHDRAQLLRVVDETRAHIVDTGEQTMTLEITGEPPHVDAVIARLEPLGIIEMVRTGQVAMRRGDVALSATQYS